MSRRTYLSAAALLSGLLSFNSYAFHPLWMSPVVDAPYQPWQAAQVSAQTDLFDCGLEREGESYCSDLTYYYKLPVYAEVEVRSGRQKSVRLYREYSLISYSDLQLNLRKDGFVLVSVKINGDEFDVASELKKQSVKKADAALVRFVNQRAGGNKRTLVWQKDGRVRAVLTTTADELSVEFDYLSATEERQQ